VGRGTWQSEWNPSVRRRGACWSWCREPGPNATQRGDRSLNCRIDVTKEPYIGEGRAEALTCSRATSSDAGASVPAARRGQPEARLRSGRPPAPPTSPPLGHGGAVGRFRHLPARPLAERGKGRGVMMWGQYLVPVDPRVRRRQQAGGPLDIPAVPSHHRGDTITDLMRNRNSVGRAPGAPPRPGWPQQGNPAASA